MKLKLILVSFILVTIIITLFGEVRSAQKFVDKNIAGIIIGEDHEQKVVEIFGRGTLVQNGYAICYYNAFENQSIIFELGPDKVIEGVLLSAEKRSHCTGIDTKNKNSFMTSKGIRLGIPMSRIIEVYGEPEKKKMVEGVVVFEYHTDSKADPQVRLFYDAYLYFQDNKLIKLHVHDGE